MVLPSAQISFDQIRIELAIPTKAPFSIEDAENGNTGAGYPAINQCSAQKPSATNPASMQEWWSYNHTATGSIYLTNTEGSAATSAEACALSNANGWTLYVVGSVYYRDSNCSTLLNDYYRDSTSTNWYQFSGGALVSTGTCTPTSTTTTTLACICSSKNSTCTVACPYQCSCTSPDTTPCYSPCA